MNILASMKPTQGKAFAYDVTVTWLDWFRASGAINTNVSTFR